MAGSLRGAARPAPQTESGSEIADTVEDTARQHPWLEHTIKIGWIAKGVVYTLMGLAAIQVARLDPRADDASPEGSLGKAAEAPFGRALVGLLAIGLFLYFCWRVLSVAVIRGNDASSWGDRVGYSFSGVFYLLLSISAGKAAISGVDPEGANAVESLSSTVMDSSAGRLLVGVAGVVTLVVGAYFVVQKGIRRSFADQLRGVNAAPTDNEPKRAALVVAGVIGWIGRGVVTMIVGFFVLRSAYRFDPDDARGFDRALRRVAGTSTGSILVLTCAVGLVAYGAFCFFSYRFRTLEDS